MLSLRCHITKHNSNGSGQPGPVLSEYNYETPESEKWAGIAEFEDIREGGQLGPVPSQNSAKNAKLGVQH
eukprot:2498827-Karenia_brevis.AAC.1